LGFHPREVYADDSVEYQSFDVVAGKCTVKYIDDIEDFDRYVDQNHCYFFKLKHDVNVHSFVTARAESIKEVLSYCFIHSNGKGAQGCYS
jgi:hypothetical protein